MQNELSTPLQPIMTVLHTRPTKVLPSLKDMSISDVYVQCRIATTDEDVHVPLRAIFALFAQELKSQITAQQNNKTAH